MYVLIDVSGTVVHVPLTGEHVQGGTTTLRFLGIVDSLSVSAHTGSGSVIVSPDRIRIAEVRKQQVFDLIPVAPAFITIDDLSSQVPGIHTRTIRRYLHQLESQKLIRSVRPASRRRGSNARRWMRSA